MSQQDTQQTLIVEIAVLVPLRQCFDFIVENNQLPVEIGARVLVPFGPRKLVGLVVNIKSQSELEKSKLKTVIKVLDKESVFEPALWKTLLWISRYYLAPIGEVLSAALPVHLRQQGDLTPASIVSWQLSEYARSAPIDELKRAPLQLAIIKRFLKENELSAEDFRDDNSSWRSAIDRLIKKGWLEHRQREPGLSGNKSAEQNSIELNQLQQQAVKQIQEANLQEDFNCVLLHGVTGSGKTEVYFEIIQAVVEQGKQVLLLVPEIGLTPQLIRRVQQRFSQPVVALHSGMNKTERHTAWWHARQGNAKLVIGTRSAVFCCLPDLGLIVVDEEHDGSYKQQDGVRYQARDVAIYRAKQQSVPIILGSATPSLESYANAQAGRYQLVELKQRATEVELPEIQLLDSNNAGLNDGLSIAMLEQIEYTIEQGKQAMLFLNRRGFAPVQYCSNCKQAAQCHRCDSYLTYHQRANQLRCHHCGYQCKATKQCASCLSETMVDVGEGTQRVEEALKKRFPQASILRIDRDTVSRKGELDRLLEQARGDDVDIVLGTQLVTKGHDFPNLTFVGVLNVDHGLYSSDFRASELLFQQLLQVAGRAGRRQQKGRVLIQTAFPENPFFEKICQHDFDGFADDLLEQRRAVNFPPFGYFALLRAESTHQSQALQFLRRVKQQIQKSPEVQIMDVVPAPMERRAGKYRAQLLFSSNQRSALNHALSQWLDYHAQQIKNRQIKNNVRWSLDIDPLDHY